MEIPNRKNILIEYTSSIIRSLMNQDFWVYPMEEYGIVSIEFNWAESEVFQKFVTKEGENIFGLY